jgi:DNA invertase Pin-like site-specific DNA recombinase
MVLPCFGGEIDRSRADLLDLVKLFQQNEVKFVSLRDNIARVESIPCPKAN